MNTLAIGSLAIISCLLFGYWLYRRGLSEGGSQQAQKDKDRLNEKLAKKAKDFYDGNIGSDALGVRKPYVWHEDTGADTGVRVESQDNNGDRRQPESGSMPDR